MPFFNTLASETKYLVTGGIGSRSGKKQTSEKVRKLFPPQCSLNRSLHVDGHEKVCFCSTVSLTTLIFSDQWKNSIK